MSQWGKRVILLVLAAAAAFAAGCELPPNRVDFIEKLSKENRRLARSMRPFHDAINELVANGKPVNAAQVRTAYDGMEKTLAEVKADMSVQQLPSNSNSGPEFLAAYKEYLDGEEDILQTCLLPIVKEVETPTGNSQAVVKDLVAKSVAKENDNFNKVTQVQSKFASEHNLQVYQLAIYLDQQKKGK